MESTVSGSRSIGHQESVGIPADGAELEGLLELPDPACGAILFAHGSGSSRFSPRNRAVARGLQASGFATLLFDLLTREEDRRGEARFEISLLAGRLSAAARWIRGYRPASRLPIGYFGASTGAAAALISAAELGPVVRAVVSRGGRPDLAGDALGHVRAPTLLLAGELDEGVVELNRRAYERLHGEKRLHLVPGAAHLFEEPGALEEVSLQAAEWFRDHLGEGP